MDETMEVEESTDSYIRVETEESDKVNESYEGESQAQKCKPTKCLIHVVATETSQLHEWHQDKWNGVRRAAAVRRAAKHFRSSKYRDVIEALPNQPSDTDGYHTKCYKNLTAVSTKIVPLPDSVETKRLRSVNSSTTSSGNTVGIFPDECLFCGKTIKTRSDGQKEHLSKIQTKQAEQKIIDIVTILKLDSVLVKISGVDLIAKEAKIHHTCRADKIAKANRIKKGLGSKSEKVADTPFVECICAYVEEAVINGKRPELLTSIYDRFCDLHSDQDILPSISTVQYFGEFLKKRFQGRINLHSPECKRSGVIVHSSTIDYATIRAAYDFKSSAEGQVTQAALLLRRALQNVKKEPLSDPLTIESLKQGEGTPPHLVKMFFGVLLGGLNPHKQSESVNRRADSMSQDALFIVKHGTLKPAKHILTAMSLKSLTGSRKIITMMNKFGSCLNYNSVEELETELAYAIIERQCGCPDGATPGVPCGLAFDNYDEQTHTLSGFDTLHDTMGIFYQINSETASPSSKISSDLQGVSSQDLKTKIVRRKLDVPCMSIAPYRKKPRMDYFSYPDIDFRALPHVFRRARKLDLLWMAAHALEMENIPMWTGFNARFYVDHLPKQIVLYMPNIDRSPTSSDVVAETLRITQKCIEESGQPYGVVSYDLDVAKTAIKIQVTEQPLFDNVFILFGAFHLQMCLFRAIGKIIKESGLPEMLVETEVLAHGSMRGFLECTNFNRCKRLHPMLALALETLHFRKFLASYETIDLVKEILNSAHLDDACPIDVLLESTIFDRLFEDYESFSQLTLDGHLGKTAKFCMEYVRRVGLFHLIDRAVRETNIDMYVGALTQVIDIFFATNRHNYARWMSKHQLDLMNLPKTHPGLKELLAAGLFSIRRTNNQFSRLPVDLTLEQTINADAASRMTGFTAATNNYSARLRWSVTKGGRAALISAALELAGMQTSNAQAELSNSRVRRDNDDLKKLITTIIASVNPYDMEIEALINIHTGKSASPEISCSLLSIEQIGSKKHTEFVQECAIDPARFEQPIKRNKLMTFVDQGAKNRRSQHPIVKELRCTRDMLGRIAIIATKITINFEFMLTYPLTSVPLTLCRTDGTMVHTDKSALFSLLEDKVKQHGSPKNISAHLIDGNFLLHCLPPNLPPTYGGLSRAVLHAVLAYPSRRVDIVFDTNEEPWIKDCEQERRGAEETIFTISGPEQVRPKNFATALKSASFKQQLPRFLMKDWVEQHHAPVLSGREVYLGVDEQCAKFSVDNGRVDSKSLSDLNSNHPEADTRVCLHLVNADQSLRNKDIVVRATDTDIMVLLLHHCHRVTSNIWMEVGTSGRGNRRYVNITAIATELGPEYCAALPGFHAYTGCDYTAAFARKGKKRPFLILEQDARYLKAFSSLATAELDNATCKAIEDYTCALYGARKSIPINKYRYHVFEKAYGPRDDLKPLDRLKGVDASGIPPCEAVMKQKLARSNFVARMWNSACNNNVPKRPSLGWELMNNSYRPIWYEGRQMPESVVPESSSNYGDDDSDTESLEQHNEDEEDLDIEN